MHVPMPLGRHGRQALNVWYTVPPAWLCQQSTAVVECRRQHGDLIVSHVHMTQCGQLSFADVSSYI